MSFQAMTWAVEQELPAMQKIVLLMMANRTGNDNGICYPSHERLAKDCGMEKRSVIRQIEKLETAGLLTVIRSVDDKGMKAVNKYRLHLDAKAAPMCHKVTTVVTESHEGSDTKSLGGSDTKSHKPVSSFNQSINQSIKQERDAPKPEPVIVELVKVVKFDYKKFETPDFVNREWWDKWMDARKQKKAAMTELALMGCLDDLIRIFKADIDVTQAMKEGAENQWKRIGKWYIENNTGNSNANNSKSNQKISAAERVKRACKLDEYADVIPQQYTGNVINCTDYSHVGF